MSAQKPVSRYERLNTLQAAGLFVTDVEIIVFAKSI